MRWREETGSVIACAQASASAIDANTCWPIDSVRTLVPVLSLYW